MRGEYKMKKFITFILLSISIISLCACNANYEKSNIDITKIDRENIQYIGSQASIKDLSSIESLVNSSDIIILGKVIKVEYLETYYPTTLSYVKVYDCYMGNIKRNEIIYVYEAGGIMKLSKWKSLPQIFNQPAKDGYTKPSITEEDENKYVYYTFNGAPLPVADIDVICFLQKVNEPASSQVDNTDGYFLTGAYQGKFIKDKNQKNYKRFGSYYEFNEININDIDIIKQKVEETYNK